MFLKASTAMIAAAVLSALSMQTANATNLKLAHQFAPDSLPGESARHFAALVAEKTNHNDKITVLPGGALGDQNANLQQVASGSIDMALTGDGVISFMAQPYMIVSMPFLYDNPQDCLTVFNGKIGQEIDQYLDSKQGIHSLGWQYIGTRELTANRPIKTLADLKGLKMRLTSAKMPVDVWSKTGVDATSIAFTELYLALQTGTVDAQENPPNFIRAQKFYEVQKYLMMTNHIPQMQAFFINSAIYKQLDPATRQAIDEAARETTEWTDERAAELQKSDIEWLTTKGGMTLVDINMTGIQNLIKDVPAQLLGDRGKQLYKEIRAMAQ